MKNVRPLLRPLAQSLSRHQPAISQRQRWICQECLHTSHGTTASIRAHRPPQPFRLRPQRRHQSQQPADNPTFSSIVDNPPTPIRSNRKHNRWGLAILAAIPITAFFLGCWQVQRLNWKTDLIAKVEDRLVRDPLPLPPRIDPDAVKDFDYRRVYARGRFRHDKEMLIGPRLHDGEDGYLVITPLEREGRDTTILVCRGWIPRDKAAQSSRHPSALPQGELVVEGLLREPWKKNSFTPENQPEQGKWYFPDVYQMAEHTGSQAVWIEETMKPDLIVTYDRTAKGLPVGRAPEVNLRNNHTQYIFTWFSLSLATSIMLWMVVRRSPGGGRGRARRSTGW